MLHGDDGERVRMKRTCPEHDEVKYDEIVKGHPVGDGQYVVLAKEELQSLEPEKSKTIDISDFVELKDVDPTYFESTYHLIPDETGAKAYRSLVEALEETGKVAIGTFVMRNREHLVAIRTWEDGLVLHTPSFDDEVVKPSTAQKEGPAKREPSDKERMLAVQLVESLSGGFEPGKYEATYRQKLMSFIEKKAKGETIKVVERKREAAAIEDLVKALEKSLQEIAGRSSRCPSVLHQVGWPASQIAIAGPTSPTKSVMEQLPRPSP